MGNREEEWILTEDEVAGLNLLSNMEELLASANLLVDLWRYFVNFNTYNEQKKYIGRLKQYSKGCRIGSQTFSSGLNLVLLEACHYGHIKVLQFLFKYKQHFNVDALIHHSSNLLYYPCVHFEFTASNSLVDVLQETTLVHVAARSDRVNILEFLVSQGASINVRDCGSLTPLIAALKRGSIRAAQFLIHAGADVRCANLSGQTPLMYALYCHNTSILHALLQAGADPRQCDHRGYTALHYAMLKFDSSKVEFLLDIPGILLASQAAGPDVLMLASVQENQSSSAVKTLEILRKHPEYSHKAIVDSFLLRSTTVFLQCLKAVIYNSNHHHALQKCIDGYVSSLSMKSTGTSRLSSDQSGHSEIETVEEFNRRAEVEDPKFVLAYQCITIRERCLLNTANEAIIDSLFTVGMLLFGHNYKIGDGLAMWLRASRMLLSLFHQHSADVSMLPMLHSLLSTAVQYNLSVTQTLSRDHQQPRGFSVADFSQEDRQNAYLPMLENLIECLHFEITLDNHRHTHDRRCHNGCSKVLFGVLKSLSNLQVSINVETLVAEVLTKCPWFYDQTSWPQSVLHLAITRFSNDPRFITLLLENGGNRLINEPGYKGLSPLAQAIETDSNLVASTLLKHGAHIDRVDANGDTSVDARLIDLPLPLACLASRAVIRESIPYKKIDIAPRLKTLIAHHDKNEVRLSVKSRIHLMTSQE